MMFIQISQLGEQPQPSNAVNDTWLVFSKTNTNSLCSDSKIGGVR